MVLIEKVAEQSKNNMYNNTLDGVSAYVQQSVCNSPVPVRDQQEGNAENCTQLPYHAHFNDMLTEYPAWSTDANDIENTNQDQYRSGRQEILTAWQKDTKIKTPDNRQVLDNLEAYVRDKLNISRALHNRLGLTENSLPEAQTITVAMVQSDQLITRIPNYASKNIGIGQENDNDYLDNREDYLYQVDGTNYKSYIKHSNQTHCHSPFTGFSGQLIRLKFKFTSHIVCNTRRHKLSANYGLILYKH